MSNFAICQMMEQKRQKQINPVPPVRLQLISPYRNETLTGAFISQTGITKRQLDMRRKIEILKYQNNNGKTSSTQQFATLVTASSSASRRSSANDCISTPTKTSSSNIPGPVIVLTYDDTVPLYNYIPRNLTVGTLPEKDNVSFRFHKLEGQVIELNFNFSTVYNNTNLFIMDVPVTIGYLQIYENIPSAVTSFKLNAVMTFPDISSSVIVTPNFANSDHLKIFFSETEIIQKKQISTTCFPSSTSSATLASTVIAQLPTVDGYIYKLQCQFSNFSTSIKYINSTLKCVIDPADITVQII
jgi:hypothetical protein